MTSLLLKLQISGKGWERGRHLLISKLAAIFSAY
ncbi:hypothetical protein FF1_043679 [Malus domestica]